MAGWTLAKQSAVWCRISLRLCQPTAGLCVKRMFRVEGLGFRVKSTVVTVCKASDGRLTRDLGWALPGAGAPLSSDC